MCEKEGVRLRVHTHAKRQQLDSRHRVTRHSCVEGLALGFECWVWRAITGQDGEWHVTPARRVQGSGFRVQGAGFRFQVSGFRFQDSGSRVGETNMLAGTIGGSG